MFRNNRRIASRPSFRAQMTPPKSSGGRLRETSRPGRRFPFLRKGSFFGRQSLPKKEGTLFRFSVVCARPAAELLSGEPGTTSTLYTVFSKIALIQVNLKWEFREKISRQNWAFFTNFTYCPAAAPSRTRSPGGGFFVRGLGFPHRGTEARRFFTARPMENQCKRAHGGKEQEWPLP